MLKSEKREIAGRKYIITQLPTGKGLPVLMRLFKVLGPALGAGLKNADPKSGLGGLGYRGVGELISELATRMSTDDLAYLVDTFSDSTEVDFQDGRVLPMNDVKAVEFAGKYAAMFQWIRACVEINFADFLEELKRIARQG